MAPFFTGITRGIGGGGFGRSGSRSRRFGPQQTAYQVFTAPGTLNTNLYGTVDSIQYLSITSGSGGSPGGGSSPGGPEGPGGPGGPSGKVSYQEFIYGTAIVPQPINTSPPGSYSPVVSGPSPGNPSPSVISVPAPVAANYPGYTFTPSPNGTNGIQPQGWAGQGGYGGAGGIVITAPNVVGGPIPSVSSGGGNTGGSAGGRPGGTGGSGASGYGAGGGGGGGGGEQDGDTAGGGPGGGGAPGIVIAKITYRNEIF